MKSLKESLFDKDLVTRKFPIEKYMGDFSSYALEKLDPVERNALLDTLFESGAVCNAAELRKTPVDLTKNIIIMRSDDPNLLNNLDEIHYPYRYSYIYSISIRDEDEKTFIASLDGTSSGKYYYWDNEGFPRVDKARSWKGKVAAFYTPNCSYSIISNEKWVKEIIDSVLAD